MMTSSPDRGDALRRYLAELVGTFVLVLSGVGAAVLAGSTIGALGVAFAFGLALLAMVYAIGPISGCHVNPAVTLGLLLSGKMERRHVMGYVGAQAFGALLGAGVVLVIAQGSPDGYAASSGGLGANGYGEHSPAGFGIGAAFVIEVVLTMVLAVTVMFATDDVRRSASPGWRSGWP